MAADGSFVRTGDDRNETGLSRKEEEMGREKTGMKNMIEGKPFGLLLAFAVPMILSNLFQQFYNLIDSVIVGNYLGTDALAAVGSVGAVTAVLVQLASGLALGGSIVISQYYGAKLLHKVRTCTTTMAVFSAVLGAVITVLMLFAMEPVLTAIQTPPELMGYSLSYLNIYVLGCIPLFFYNALNGVYVALGNSRTPLYFLIASSVLNVVLDLLFIVNLNLGVGGAALATTISQTGAALLAAADLPGRLRKQESEEKPSFFDWQVLGTMLKYALPAALQQSIVSVGSVVVQGTINSFGAVVMAGTSAASKVVNIATAIPINFGNAFSNYVGQNIGAGKSERVGPGLRVSILTCGGISLLVTAVLELFSNQIISLFVSQEEASEVIAVGAEYIRVVGAFLIVFAVFMMIKAVFKGSGDMGWFIFCTLISFFVRLILTVGFAHRLGVGIIWWSFNAGWVVALFFSVFRYLQGGWRKKGLIKTAGG